MRRPKHKSRDTNKLTGVSVADLQSLQNYNFSLDQQFYVSGTSNNVRARSLLFIGSPRRYKESSRNDSMLTLLAKQLRPCVRPNHQHRRGTGHNGSMCHSVQHTHALKRKPRCSRATVLVAAALNVVSM